MGATGFGRLPFAEIATDAQNSTQFFTYKMFDDFSLLLSINVATFNFRLE